MCHNFFDLQNFIFSININYFCIVYNIRFTLISN